VGLRDAHAARDEPRPLDGQINSFLRTGIVPDVCGTSACQAAPGIG
jgi:hypothetical protein